MESAIFNFFSESNDRRENYSISIEISHFKYQLLELFWEKIVFGPRPLSSSKHVRLLNNFIQNIYKESKMQGKSLEDAEAYAP